MRVVGLVSGGKDSCYNLIECLREGHEIVALANLKPKDKDELDSYMYQTVGHDVIDVYAEAVGIPLYRRTIDGSSCCQDMNYKLNDGDEVEDLLMLLKDVQEEIKFDGVSVGAILSDYQRIRVENVCQRLGLQCLSYLWQRDQDELLEEMIDSGVNAVIIKVAALGLEPKKHLLLSIKEMLEPLRKLNKKFGLNICGEGGEYETMTLDCPIFLKKIIIDDFETVLHSDDAFAPVGYLKFSSMHLEDKGIDPSLSLSERLIMSPFEATRSLRMKDFNHGDVSLLQRIDDNNIKARQMQGSELFGHYQQKDMPTTESPVVKNIGKNFIQISNLTTDSRNTNGYSYCAKLLLEKLKGLLFENGCTLKDCVLVHLFVKDMTKFVEVNEVYKDYFTENPPARVCIEMALDCPLKIDCLAVSTDAADSSEASDVTEKKILYVQSISRWAPANIGPYSQAVKIGSSIFVSGQIGLVPASMQMVEGGIEEQAWLSLRHVGRVLKAVDASCGISDAIRVTCYVTSAEYIDTAREIFLQACNSASWKGIFEPVVVTRLPRNALVEWGFIAQSGSSEY